jgi:hypothetical protein
MLFTNEVSTVLEIYHQTLDSQLIRMHRLYERFYILKFYQ